MRYDFFILAIFVTIIGCAAPAPDEAETPLEPAAEHFLVWWSVEEAGYATALVRDNPGASATLVAEGDGVLIAADGELWTWEEEPVLATQYDCDCVMEAEVEGGFAEEPPERCRTEREVVHAAFVEIDGEERLPLGEPPSGVSGEQEPQPILLGSAGPYAMATQCTYTYVCGAAHGGTECTFFAYNLMAAAPMTPEKLVEPLSKADQVALLNGQAEEEVNRETLRGLVEVKPRWDDGEARLAAVYAADTCYACSDGEWSSYTFTGVDPDATPRIGLEDPPPAVFEMWPTEGPRGWSRLPRSEVERAVDFLR